MSGKADLKYEQKLVCARMAIDCLKGDKILATQEDEDKFIVGLFSEERKFCDWELSGFNGVPARLFDTIESTHSLMKSLAAAGEIP